MHSHDRRSVIARCRRRGSRAVGSRRRSDIRQGPRSRRERRGAELAHRRGREEQARGRTRNLRATLELQPEDGGRRRRRGGTRRTPCAARIPRSPSTEDDHAARGGFSGRQVRTPGRARPHHGQPGDRSPRDDAVHPRPRGRPRHRLLHHRLPRLADAQYRQGAVVREALPPRVQHPLPAGHQRGPRRDRHLGHPAGDLFRRLPARRHLLHVVRQGSGPRPKHGRHPPRSHGRKLPPRRGAGDGRRRSRADLDRRAGRPRVRLRRAHDAVPLPLHRARGAELRPARNRALAILGDMGWLQGGAGHGGRERAHPGGSVRPGDHASRRLRDAGGWPQPPDPRLLVPDGAPPPGLEARRRRGLRGGPTG